MPFYATYDDHEIVNDWSLVRRRDTGEKAR
jgi:phosphodiesterase/alkaline phosphatase D-like protein